MTELEKKLLDELQKGIPLVDRPFQEIGNKIGIEEEEVVQMIDRMRAKQYIRRFGGIIDINKLGIKSTLIGMKVEENMEEVVTIINSYKGVTHNYERDCEYNLWFTLMEKSQKELYTIIKEIQDKINVKDLIQLPATKKYKTNVYFRFNELIEGTENSGFN